MTVFGWTVTTVSLNLAAYACRVSGRRNASRAMGSMALIVAVLLLDDLLQLHSAVVPQLVGGSKWTLILAEAFAVAVWVGRWNGEILRTRWELLVAASIGFATSLGLDRFPLSSARWSLVAEDGAKVLAVLALATWAVSTATDLIRSLAQAGTIVDNVGGSIRGRHGRRELHGSHRDVVA
jgi:hypothetical protein